MKNLSLTHQTRRDMLRSLGLGSAAVGIGSVLSSPRLSANTAQSASPGSRNPYIYAFTIGDLEAWSISDGFMIFGQGLKMMYPESERPAMKTALEDIYEPTDVLPLYINVLVVRSDREVMLFDAGFGIVERSDQGWLMEGLSEIGIQPEDVTAAFLSHAHGDHQAGFISPEQKPMFPNAAIYTTREEYAFWRQKDHDFSQSRRNPKSIPGMVKKAQERFEILGDNVQPTAAGARLFGGTVTIENGFGHTPGHALFRIESAGESLLHIVDSVHHHMLMFRDPKWSIGLDHTPKLAVATRQRIFAQAAQSRTRCYGFHIPWPGIGHIGKQGSGYTWIPERQWW